MHVLLGLETESSFNERFVFKFAIFKQFAKMHNKPAVEELTATVTEVQGGGARAFTRQVE